MHMAINCFRQTFAMENKNNNKINGVYYTPPTLANFLVEPLVDQFGLTFFDPAYGNGALLESTERILNQKFPSTSNYNYLFGCDINLINKNIDNIPQSQLYKTDFFKFSDSNKYHNIIMNPPYVRNRNIDPEIKKLFDDLLNKNEINLYRKADLWVYFLVKSINHLEINGNIGAIIPWSFLQAEYSINLRKWLYDKFEEIKIIALGNNYFDDADERIIVLWLKNYSKKTKSVRCCFANNHDECMDFTILEKKDWESNTINFSKENNVDKIINEFKTKYGFQEFRNFADVRIGIVTGANKYFIKTYDEAKKIGFHGNQLIPIYTSTKELTKLRAEQKPKKSLLIIHPRKKYIYNDYINYGIEEQINLRAHSKLRNCWYYIKKEKIPDAFFHYRNINIPHLILNTKYQCTNSIHRIYFKNLSDNEKKWVQISLLSAPGLLSLERYSKIYGSGVLKIEPGSLYNSIVYKCDNAIDKEYNQISKMVSNNKKKNAVDLATKLIKEKLDIPDDIINKTKESLSEFRARRLNR